MRICVIGLRGLPAVIGGIEAHCEHLYPLIAAIDSDKSITLLIRRGYTAERRFTFRGIDVRALWAPRMWGVDTLIHTFWALLYARLRLSPHIVHIHGIGPGFFAALSRALGFVTVVTHHAPDYERPKWGRRGRLFLRLGERFAASCAQTVICVSAAVREQFLAHYPRAARRTIVIRNAGGLPDAGQPNASTVLDELGLEPGRYILAVGRLEATKGFDDLITAFEQAQPQGRKLVIVGSDAGNMEHAAALLGKASDTVIFAGFRTGDALRRLYEAAALFVHPSRMEGYALVVGEALSAGIPVIVSDIPAHREFALEEQCYIALGDVEALARALSIADYSRYLSTDASNRQRAESWERVADEHIALFDRLMKKGSGGERCSSADGYPSGA